MVTTGSTIVFAKPDKVAYSTTVDSGPDLGQVRVVDAEDLDEEGGDGISGWNLDPPRIPSMSFGEAFPLDEMGRKKCPTAVDEEQGEIQVRPPRTEADPG